MKGRIKLFLIRRVLEISFGIADRPYQFSLGISVQFKGFGVSHAVQMHQDTAAAKGIADGDYIWLENPEGHRVKGWVSLSNGIEPHHLAIAAVAGHWGNFMPIAKGKGTFFNDLVEMDLGHTDPLTFNQDICCRVKIYKAD